MYMLYYCCMCHVPCLSLPLARKDIVFPYRLPQGIQSEFSLTAHWPLPFRGHDFIWPHCCPQHRRGAVWIRWVPSRPQALAINRKSRAEPHPYYKTGSGEMNEMMNDKLVSDNLLLWNRKLSPSAARAENTCLPRTQGRSGEKLCVRIHYLLKVASEQGHIMYYNVL